jgi:hypothetical protein
MNTQLNTYQKQVINQNSQRMADAQAAYLKEEGICLKHFARVIGYGDPLLAGMLVREELAKDPRAGSAVLFDDAADWSRALTRQALIQLRDWAIEDTKEELDKLDSQ